jgi:phage protein D
MSAALQVLGLKEDRTPVKEFARDHIQTACFPGEMMLRTERRRVKHASRGLA